MSNADCRLGLPTAVTSWSTVHVTTWALCLILAPRVINWSVEVTSFVTLTAGGMGHHLDANVSSSWFIHHHLLHNSLTDLLLYIAVYCLEPPVINNGGFRLSTNSTIAGTVVEYYCLSNSRYRMSGPSRIVCQVDGHYDKDPPVCIGNYNSLYSCFFILVVMATPSFTVPCDLLLLFLLLFLTSSFHYELNIAWIPTGNLLNFKKENRTFPLSLFHCYLLRVRHVARW